MKVQTKLLAGLAGFALLAITASAQNPSAAEHSRKGQTANRLSADNTFVTKAAVGGMAEVELGKLAQQRASSDAVKDFGKRMETDHSKANEELKTTAANKGITLPTTLDAKHQATMDRLSKLNGAAFDRTYMQEMVKDHREDVAEFQKEANSGDDPDVKAFAGKTLPTLQEHLKMAEETDAKVKK
jgi:putative membrane protein